MGFDLNCGVLFMFDFFYICYFSFGLLCELVVCLWVGCLCLTRGLHFGCVWIILNSWLGDVVVVFLLYCLMIFCDFVGFVFYWFVFIVEGFGLWVLALVFSLYVCVCFGSLVVLVFCLRWAFGFALLFSVWLCLVSIIVWFLMFVLGWTRGCDCFVLMLVLTFWVWWTVLLFCLRICFLWVLFVGFTSLGTFGLRLIFVFDGFMWVGYVCGILICCFTWVVVWWFYCLFIYGYLDVSFCWIDFICRGW